MKHLIILLLFLPLLSISQNIVKSASINYTSGVPNYIPSIKNGSEIAIDTTTKFIYSFNRNTNTWTTIDISSTNEIELPSQTGNSGKYLTTNGSAVSWATVSASPGGSNTQIQYNSSGSFAGNSGLTYVNDRLYLADNNSYSASKSLIIGPYFDSYAYGRGISINATESGALSIRATKDATTMEGDWSLWTGGNSMMFNMRTNHGISFWTNNTRRLDIANDGDVGIGTSSPNASAKVDITSTTGGLLLPRMTTTQRDAIASPADGLYVYNSTIGNFNVYQSSSWRHVVTGEGILSGTRAALVGGTNNTASGLYSAVIGGDGCKATAQAAVAQAGTGAEATAGSSFATGSYSFTYLTGQVSMSTGTMDGPGTNQTSIFSLFKQNTGTATYELTSPTRAVLNTSINNNRVWNVRVQCVASVISVGNGTCAVGDVYSCVYQVTAKRQSNTLTLVGTPEALATPVSDANMSTASFTISADNTNKSLKVEFTPPTTAGSTTQIRAIATLYITELAWN